MQEEQRRVGIVTTMQDFPLTLTHLLRHGQTVHRHSEVASFDGEGLSVATFAEVAARAEKLAAALVTLGEVEVRGPWVTGSYLGAGAGHGELHDGWLRTGDIGCLDEDGYLVLSDRLKDVIKSGGEWISSLKLEDALRAHPGVADVAVVGVPDPLWGERPLAVVVPRKGAEPTEQSLHEHLDSRVAHSWAPERWAFVDEIPKTTVGKYDRRALRARYAAG